MYQNPKRHQDIIELLVWYVQAFLPQLAANEDHLGYAQFVDMHDDPAGAIDWLIPLAMRKAEEEAKLFQRLGHTLFDNFCTT